MGRVYRAWDPAVSRVVAVKTVKTEVLTRDTRDEFLKRFRREAQAAGGLNHPAIVRCSTSATTTSSSSTSRAALADAVDHAHRFGVIHRDIKPANVVIQPDGQILGSPSYMAPEQIAGGTITSRADVYSLAVVAFEMLTGLPPFAGDTITQVIYRVMHEPPPPPRRLNAALPERYDDVFSRALAKNPAERFATALEFVTALDLKELDLALTSPESSVPAPGVAVEDAPTLVSPARRAEAAPATPGWSRLALAGVGALAVAALGWMGLRAGARAPSWTAAPPPVTLAAATVTPSPTPSATEDRPATPPPAPSSRVKAARPPNPSPTPPPVVEGQLVELGPDVTPPVRVEGEPAPYPDAARRRGVRGTITVDMIVDETGRPTELQVVESAGPILDEAVLEAVRTWRFEPARKDGVRVKVRWRARQTYR